MNDLVQIKIPEKPKRIITDLQRVGRLNRCLSKVVDKRLNLVAESLRLGYPIFTDSEMIPTACIRFTPDGRIQYIWNREFFDKASDIAIQYIALHEALHVVLLHPQRRMNRDPMMWNIAIDIVVNDLLDDLLPPTNIMSWDDISFDPILQERCKADKYNIYVDNNSAETVFDLLTKQAKKEAEKARKKKEKEQQEENQNGNQSGLSSKDMLDKEKGEGKPQPGDEEGKQKYKGQLDSHDGWEHPLNTDTQQEIQAIVEELKEQEEQMEEKAKHRRRGRKAGTGSPHLIVELKEINKPPVVPWQSLLKNRLASVYRPNDCENWARPHRKMYDNYPDVLLPGPHESDVMTSSIFFTFDTSGSMDDEVIAEGVAIGKSLPEEQYEVDFTWFDTQVYEAPDLTKPQGRGGTSFQCVEEVITGREQLWKEYYPSYSSKSGLSKKSDKEITKYPDIVICFTDGESSTPMLQFPERWVFLIIPGGTDQYIKDLGATIWRVTE